MKINLIFVWSVIEGIVAAATIMTPVYLFFILLELKSFTP